jgi:hypothetical protein
MNFCFVLIDQTTADAGYGRVTTDILTTIASALEAYLNEDIRPEFGGEFTVRVGSSPTDVLPNEVACKIVDDLSQVAPGAAAYHDDENGQPVIWAALDEFASFFAGNSALSEGLAHELAELVVDSGANQWADRPDGSEEAKEECDRLQGSGYLKNGCMVANFLLRSAWVPGAAGPWDFKGVLANQYDSTPDGYVILRTQGANVKASGKGLDNMSALKLARKRHQVSRTYRRGVRL